MCVCVVCVCVCVCVCDLLSREVMVEFFLPSSSLAVLKRQEMFLLRAEFCSPNSDTYTHTEREREREREREGEREV